MNARAEAYERLNGRYETRVLEPSPPAVADGPWFADDPAARGDVPAGRNVVSPVRTADLRWDDLAATDPELAEWCADRWLGAYRQVGPVPAELVPTRIALHRVAEQVVSPARRNANGKIGLRYTRGGFGTPFFGADVQVRVRGAELVLQDASGERAGAGNEADPSRVQLWPEQFDLAVELGSEAKGSRAAYGLSPGDEHHPEPYLYVAPWVAPAPGELWQATGFSGAELPYSELLGVPDQRGTALAFFRARLRALVG